MAGKTHFPRAGGNTWVQSFYANNYPDAGIVGNVIYVNSVTGTDAATNGFSPEAPLASIAYAVSTAATADNNDLVLVMPGHVEVITAAAGVNMNVAGVTVRGLGIGRQRGTVTYTTAAGASFDINAARCCVDNLTFVGTGVASVTSMINVKAADFTIQNSEFEHANSTNQAVDVISTTTAANRLWVNSNDFHGSANAGTKHCVLLNGGTDIEIYNNNFQGAYHASEGIVRIVTTATVNLVVNQNIFQSSTASNTKSIVDSITGSTGQIRNNMMQILSGTAPITAATMSWVSQNYYANAVATAGTLI